MAVLAINISERSRNWLSLTLLLLNLCLAMMSFLMIVVGTVLAVLFSQQKAMLKSFSYKKHTHFIIFSGLVLIAIHLAGAKICHDFSNIRNRIRVLKFILPYMGLLFGAFLLMSALSISCSTAIRSLQKGFEKGFKDIMDSYDVNKEKKREIDIMQFSHKCCGSTSYKDWLEISWHSEEYIRPELKSKKGRGVPFTCCDPSYMGPCAHDAGDSKRPGYKEHKEKAYYSNGCSESITLTVRWLLRKLALWLLLPIWLELVTLILVKYLQSSAQDAMDYGDELGKGYGYLIDKCPSPCFDFLDCDIHAMRIKRKQVNNEIAKKKETKKYSGE